jgi:hypothetical protein
MSQNGVGIVRDETIEAQRQRAWLIFWAVPAVLFLAAAYELTLLVDLWGSYDGSASDGFIDAEENVAAAAYLTMFGGSVAAFVHAIFPRAVTAVALFAPAAAAFVITRFYVYDPYYFPTLRRYSDYTDPTWVLGLCIAALVVGVLTRLLPRIGSIATVCIMFLLMITSVLVSAGH